MLLGYPEDASAQSSEVVTAAYVPSGSYLPFLIVDDQGLLTKKGYSLTLRAFNKNSEMISQFLNGKVDVTAQSCLTMFSIEDKTPNLFKFIYKQYGNSMFFVVPSASGINALHEPAGQNGGNMEQPVAASHDGATSEKKRASARLIRQRCRCSHLRAASDLGPALQNGHVDAIFVFDSVAASMVATGQFRYLEEGAIRKLIGEPGFFNGGAFIPTRLVTEDPAKAEAIRDAFSKALEIIRNEPELVDRILEKWLKLSPEVARQMKQDTYEWPNEDLIQAAKGTLDILVKSNERFKPVDVRSMFFRPNR